MGGGASFGWRFSGYSRWLCRSKRQLGQGAEIVEGAERPQEGRTKLGSREPSFFSLCTVPNLVPAGLESAGGGWTQVLVSF